MPRFPRVSDPVAAMGGSVYSAFAHKLADFDGEVYPLHVGDTWMAPAQGCRVEDIDQASHPGVNRYASVRGLHALIDAIVQTEREASGVGAPDEVLVTAGGTGGLYAAVSALVNPGDEVLIQAPYWPLIAGMVRICGGTVVPLPLLEVDDEKTAAKVFAEAVSERTVAVYLNTPHNPTGRVIPGAWLEAWVAQARAHDLWILTDEVYDRYVYRGEHVYGRTLAPERTLAAWSFSKAFGVAGQRCGYLTGPSQALDHVRKVSTHTFYSTPTASQYACLNALTGAADAWVESARASYRAAGEAAAERLGLPPPEGSTFLFFDVADALDERGLPGLLATCVERGLLIAPGPSFGEYPTHVRLCFTSAPPDAVARGVEILAELLGR